MKKLQLSPLDLGVIIAFVVIGLLGGGAWWYLSGGLNDALTDVTSAKSDFDKFSVNQGIVVSPTNRKTLEDNIEQIRSHLDPLIADKLLAKGNTLAAINQQDPVAWKHDFNKDVSKLTAEAKARGVKLPTPFSFGFSRYVSTNPTDDQTLVLSKQLRAIELISNIMINAPVKSITAIRRTYEEDGHPSAGAQQETDHLAGMSIVGGADAYTAYPFEVDFEGSTDSLRKVVDDLVESPYVFIVRSVSVQNQQSTSPRNPEDLDRMAGTGNAPSVTSSSPGEVAAAPVAGPQFLFSDATLRLKLRIDLIEWRAASTDEPAPAGKSGNQPSSKKS